jgi:NTP pyrophosphatase (non-canonical NTP hydrolase)
LGLTGEAGEVAELLKKHLFHSRPLDQSALLNELGDVLWYLTALATTFGFTLTAIAQNNIHKLSQRYPTQAPSRNHDKSTQMTLNINDMDPTMVYDPIENPTQCTITSTDSNLLGTTLIAHYGLKAMSEDSTIPENTKEKAALCFCNFLIALAEHGTPTIKTRITNLMSLIMHQLEEPTCPTS